MANRYPLIVNPSTNQIQEIPFADTLDLSGNTINQINVIGVSSLGTVQVSSGIVTASSGIVTYYGDGSKLQIPIVSISTSGLSPATGFSTVSYGSTVNLDMATLDAQYRTINLSGDLTFTTSNRANGRTLVLRLIADSAQRTLTFPIDWKFLGTKPTGIASSKTAALSLTFFGSTDADCIAAYAVQS